MYSSHQGGKPGLAVMDTVLPTKQCQLEILCPRERERYTVEALMYVFPNGNSKCVLFFFFLFLFETWTYRPG